MAIRQATIKKVFNYVKIKSKVLIFVIIRNHRKVKLTFNNLQYGDQYRE
jgi:hypothetical protein